MKRAVKKCDCGQVTDPFRLSIVKDAWVKGKFAHFEWDCPRCKKTHVSKIVWD
jgi:hypothetical protein